ncbi:bifunctional glutamate N-acetyltransferase/amino-acid acetyltransferase ArgJ [Porticoccaceae bacterium]|jgi:glutamate N-acetyltransferase/amino-acid N-acetyltransferase|nr:bifunctional glutamate N-acetyltransferase/amino-acid acetyltransferase ArgJ [Porticoccaceae bacterium]MBT4213148.1 bifunctional glutamate N-acetyltransferase/amino-acid acetyltransferase ArgJ [Porticoccaceae bacterium]MDA7588644.1 bifunctional glutamate N-acetyltransferase/amino-acid acetyltransferase ArgJ [Porticoccaceae bacterium]MDB3884134.1 bifunctional glutamate N-acetyltransferase/amino-acid acetyltransferase ArgJ [Porticoccaceae bacterium]MDC3199380.1 bifunctional glutamate N-acetylt
MATGTSELPELHPVLGFKLGTTSAGIKSADRPDLVVMEIAEGSSVAALFTKNAFCAAPVTVCKERLARCTPRYLVTNTGNANAGTGEQGLLDATQTCSALATLAGVEINTILPFSTGVIGELLPIDKLLAGLPDAFEQLSESGWTDAAQGILTTDTRAKGSSTQFGSDKPVTITGIAKGSGMIKPNMATMLAYVATDAVINEELLHRALTLATEKSFNRITVDSDTSTNDSVVLVATGASGVIIDEESFDSFLENLCQVFTDLAQAIIRDAEGSTKFVSVVVDTAINQSEALKVAYTIAESPLVKTALSASDPNWGRILAAIGRSGIEDLDVNDVQVLLNSVLIADHGARAPSYSEEAGQAAMQPEDIEIRVCLNRGDASEIVWTSDLTHEYVRINAEYRT